MSKHIDDTLLTIARDQLGIETLETRRSDRLDFHDIAVWSLKDVLSAAFRAGSNCLQAGQPVVVVTVQSGLVAEVNATIPVNVFVEDWDCPPDKPLVMNFESEPLTTEQEQRVRECLAEPTIPQKE